MYTRWNEVWRVFRRFWRCRVNVIEPSLKGHFVTFLVVLTESSLYVELSRLREAENIVSSEVDTVTCVGVETSDFIVNRFRWLELLFNAFILHWYSPFTAHFQDLSKQKQLIIPLEICIYIKWHMQFADATYTYRAISDVIHIDGFAVMSRYTPFEFISISVFAMNKRFWAEILSPLGKFRRRSKQ